MRAATLASATMRELLLPAVMYGVTAYVTAIRPRKIITSSVSQIIGTDSLCITETALA